MVVIYYCSCCFDNLNYGSETQKCATKTLLQKKSQIHQERATCGCGSQTTHTHTCKHTSTPCTHAVGSKKILLENSAQKREKVIVVTLTFFF